MSQNALCIQGSKGDRGNKHYKYHLNQYMNKERKWQSGNFEQLAYDANNKPELTMQKIQILKTSEIMNIDIFYTNSLCHFTFINTL